MVIDESVIIVSVIYSREISRYKKQEELIIEELTKLERKVPNSILKSKHRIRPVTAAHLWSMEYFKEKEARECYPIDILRGGLSMKNKLYFLLATEDAIIIGSCRSSFFLWS